MVSLTLSMVSVEELNWGMARTVQNMNGGLFSFKALNADPTGMRAIAQAVGALRRAPLRRFSSAVTQSHAGRQVNHSVPAPAETLSLDSITMPHKVEAKFESQLEAAGSEPVNSDRNHQPLSQVHK